MSQQAYKSPKTVWKWDRCFGCKTYRLGYHHWNSWEFSDGCRGSHARTPWGAIIAWNRWRKQPVLPEEDPQ